MQFFRILFFALALVILLHSCTKDSKVISISTQVDSPFSSKTMVLITPPYNSIIKKDDLNKKSLLYAIEQSLSYLKKKPGKTIFKYGKINYTALEVIQSFKLFKLIIETSSTRGQLMDAINSQFLMFGSSANPENKVMFTGYYEPIFKGNLTRTARFYVPVYKKPDDLKVLELGNFRKSLEDRTIVYRQVGKKIAPYYSRRDIMEKGMLSKRNLEIAWMENPVDLFFLQIQGSGILELPNGKLIKLAYAGANGRKYSSIGKLLIDKKKMLLEEVSMASIRQYLENHPLELKEILYHNESYTFLQTKEDEIGPRGNINVPLTAKRSVATDTFAFPKAALGYIITEVPDVSGNLQKPKKPIFRFILNQDTGGAIRGSDRVDLFWGNGDIAEKSAGSMRSYGKIFFLIARKDVLTQIQ
ncbi:MAG: murein transglycosylase [Deltaproteobacteria bacterium]|jgi:membrane-bound lytic murein transglycosylase A|nr:murein transglycosylase [Deltaproteobacteria bacterium]MBT4526774.1 murein transglycosylase [Deltaproteobacteria bacterium]